MKEYKMYKCEHCGTMYNSEQKATKCTVNNLEQAKTEITKLTWKYGDIYCVPDLTNNNVKRLEYMNDSVDHMFDSVGLLCRTKEEALEKLNKIQDFCKKEFT